MKYARKKGANKTNGHLMEELLIKENEKANTMDITAINKATDSKEREPLIILAILLTSIS